MERVVATELQRKRIREVLRTRIGRGSLLSSSKPKEPVSEHELMKQLKSLEPSGEAFFVRYDAFQFYWRHPWTRLIFVVSLWTLDLYIFGEDPTTYSEAPCRMGGSQILNLGLAFFHWDLGNLGFFETLSWHFLRLLLVLVFVLGGLVMSKALMRRLALRFEMFTYGGSYFVIAMAILSVSLFACAKVYNLILWKLNCDDPSCACEDPQCLPGMLSSNLHIRNDTFARLTQCGAFLADTLAVFSVLDLILQDQSVYEGAFCSSGLQAFWEKHRTRFLWGSFSVLALCGVIGLFFFSRSVLDSYQLSPFGHRSNIGRMVIAGLLFIIDVCIVTQDLDFPHFENSLEVKLLGTNVAFEGSFINYIMVLVSMVLDLNCLYTLGWYDPFLYGQYYLSDSFVCNRKNISDLLEIDCLSKMCPLMRPDATRWANLSSCESEDRLLAARYYPEIHRYRPFLAAVPVATGIILFCGLFRLAGRSPQNLCRRVVISNAFATKKIEEQSFEMTVMRGSVQEEEAPENRLHLMVECGHQQPHLHRVLVVTAFGVKAFELRDQHRSPHEGLDGAWMRPHVFCTRLRWWLRRKLSREAGDLIRASSREYLYLRVEDLKAKLCREGLVRTDVPFISLELLWKGRLLHNRTLLRSLGPDAVLFLLHDRWELRSKALADCRKKIRELGH